MAVTSRECCKLSVFPDNKGVFLGPEQGKCTHTIFIESCWNLRGYDRWVFVLNALQLLQPGKQPWAQTCCLAMTFSTLIILSNLTS